MNLYYSNFSDIFKESSCLSMAIYLESISLESFLSSAFDLKCQWNEKCGESWGRKTKKSIREKKENDRITYIKNFNYFKIIKTIEMNIMNSSITSFNGIIFNPIEHF